MKKYRYPNYPSLKMPYAIIKGKKRRLTERYINAVKELTIAIMAFHRQRFRELNNYGYTTIYDMAKSSDYLHCCASESPWNNYSPGKPGGAVVPVVWPGGRALKRPRRSRKPIYVYCLDKKYIMPDRLVSALEEVLLAQIEMYGQFNLGRFKYGIAAIKDLGSLDFGEFYLSNDKKYGTLFDPDYAMIGVCSRNGF